MSLLTIKKIWWQLNQRVKQPPLGPKRTKIKKILGQFIFKTLGNIFNSDRSIFLLTYRPDFDYDMGQFPDYKNFLQYWKKGNETNNGGDIARLYLLYLNAKQVIQDGVEGDFVELGVYKGNSAKILCEIGKRNNRKIFLYDTFSGFDAADLTSESQKIHNTFSDTSLESVRSFVGEISTTFIPGRFPSSFNNTSKPQQISLAHIDCDLYEPMKAGLEVFYEIMPSGGIFILHDYASGWWEGARRAVDEFLANKPESLVIMPDKSGTAIFRKL